MRTNDKKNTSAKKKLIPAVAMLTTSAIMLSTATYAWFTMSKAVEVTGIKLTATTPQTIEISLGRANTTEGGEATEPQNTDNDMEIWSNKAATSSVYASFGKLIPASSTDGFNLYYTTKATDLGKAVDISGDDPFTKATTEAAWTFQSNGKSQATSNNALADTATEGYYIDIPVWFRTTSTNAVDLGVDVEVSNPTAGDSGELYKATRVAILKANTSGAGVESSDSRATSAVVFKDNAASTSNYQKDGSNDKAVNSVADTYYGNVSYGTEVTFADSDKDTATNKDSATKVATVTAATNTGYGTPTKYYIRVWLEGEDEHCWNKNASQSFNVNLKFFDITNATSSN